MPSDIVNDWLSQHDNGEITSHEVLNIAFYHLTMNPDDARSVLAALQGHSSPTIQDRAADLIVLLEQQREKQERGERQRE